MTPELTNAVIDLFEMFPSLEDDLMDLFSALALKEITGKDFERSAKLICIDYVKKCIQTIKQGVKTDKSLFRAYYDIARYQTDCKDASIEWESDEDLLRFILRKRPIPQTPQDRHALTAPIEVTKKRELL